MSVLDIFRPRRRAEPAQVQRFGWDVFNAGEFGYGPFAGYFSSSGGYTRVEDIENSFTSYIQHAYKASGVVFACMAARQMIFSEARFQWQAMNGGKPGDLFGNPELAILEHPWPNCTTGELLARMIQDVDLAGNFYAVREDGRLRRLRPDWVSIILTAPPADAVQSDVAGYRYSPGGVQQGMERQADDEVFLPGEIVHWSPIPDPEAQYRGMSWLTPVLREIQSDKSATLHKYKFFENGATPQLVVAPKTPMTVDQFREFIAAADAEHRGVHNAYKTMYVGGGADVTVAGADLRQLDFKATQGAGETRIAAAARMHPVIVGLSEGMQGSSLNAGNFSAARRIVADGTMRPLWRSACAALETVLELPTGGPSRLWFDDRDIAFLREDQKDAAEIQFRKAQTIRTLVDAGFEPKSVVAAVEADDRTLLTHSGLYSVQLQPPGANQPSVDSAARAVFAHMGRMALPSHEVSVNGSDDIRSD